MTGGGTTLRAILKSPEAKVSRALTHFPFAAVGGRGGGDRDRCRRLLIARQYR